MQPELLPCECRATCLQCELLRSDDPLPFPWLCRNEPMLQLASVIKEAVPGFEALASASARIVDSLDILKAATHASITDPDS